MNTQAGGMDKGGNRTPLAVALAGALGLTQPAIAHAEQQPQQQPQAETSGQLATQADKEDVQRLLQELEALKASYAREVRRLRELDMQIQAMQSRLSGRAGMQADAESAQVASQQPPPPPPPTTPQPATAADGSRPPPNGSAGYASSAEEAERAREQESRSVEDVKQQNNALFNRGLVIENSISYNRYDRKQLTLNGFLALDAIFLGNIAIENVESDAINYNVAARWGISPRLTLNIDVPGVGRKTVFQKGGAGGAAAAIAQEQTTGFGLGDITVGANYKLFGENGWRPDGVLNMSITAPTGREPYGIPWKVLERDDDDYIRFAVPEEQPTGNGVWQANIGMSFVKATDPAILFANIGYIRSFTGSFDDLDSNPATVNPGKVRLGNAFYFGGGVAFAFNERTSVSLSYSNRVNARARMRYDGSYWSKVIGSDANAATFNLAVTHAVSPKTTVVAMLGMGLTPDAPDFSLGFKIPYNF